MLKMINRANGRQRCSDRTIRPELELLETRNLLATWTALSNLAPQAIGTMMLLSDGTVMGEGTSGSAVGGVSNAWFKLTPNANGSYANGTWTSLATMNRQRLYYGSNVLPSGKVFLVGGEYSGASGSANWTNTGEMYDPVANSWSNIANFPQTQFGDDPTMVLPNGDVLAGYLSGPQTYIYHPLSNTWTAAGTKLRGDRSDEETWVKLPDDSILTYEIFSTNPAIHAQRYVPSSNTWVDAGILPNTLTSSALGFELGPTFLLPEGRVFQIGANNQTALYDPASNTWVAGPSLPSGMGADDAPGAMMPNGHVIFTADRSSPLFNPPTKMFDFDPNANTITDITSTLPSALHTLFNSNPSYPGRMLMLPNGQVLFAPNGFGVRQLYVYTPDGAPDDSWRPVIYDVSDNGGGNFTLMGTQLNGISAGASYGDDAEMDTNYPIVRLVNSATGIVYYARSSNWSSTGVQTGSAIVTTDFKLPGGMPAGTYEVYVSANGIDSYPLDFYLASTSPSSADTIVDGDSGDASVGGQPGGTLPLVVRNISDATIVGALKQSPNTVVVTSSSHQPVTGQNESNAPSVMAGVASAATLTTTRGILGATNGKLNVAHRDVLDTIFTIPF